MTVAEGDDRKQPSRFYYAAAPVKQQGENNRAAAGEPCLSGVLCLPTEYVTIDIIGPCVAPRAIADQITTEPAFVGQDTMQASGIPSRTTATESPAPDHSSVHS